MSRQVAARIELVAAVLAGTSPLRRNPAEQQIWLSRDIYCPSGASLPMDAESREIRRTFMETNRSPLTFTGRAENAAFLGLDFCGKRYDQMTPNEKDRYLGRHAARWERGGHEGLLPIEKSAD